MTAPGTGSTRQPPRRGAAYWICFAVVLLSASVSVWYSVTAVIAGGLEDADALYAASRSVAIVVVALIVPLFPADAALLAIAVVMVIVQGIDTFVGAVQGNTLVMVGAAVLCIVNIVTASFLARTDRVRGAA
ncbi:hypothetical protein ARHIZOSPH14_18780 [Agromyces rhizosphaerae]|uniref:Uncharacterized protein n=1 Tax=Agromyces rhizosphaerae TaxID=88374 RepID=A0A9W6CX55_9MICO|nr:hypothetical protein [Agromyces rhizosphaerae]GLI27636.1 hypothetical protein ARHIZOSPH14_18780 [Agromyces rhizosphaerae]